MRKYLIFFSFFFTLCLVSAPFPVPQKPDESLAREASAAALRGVYYLVSQQDGKGNFSSDPGLDRAIAALTESFSAGEPDLKTALNRRKRNTENVVPGTKISGDESAGPAGAGPSAEKTGFQPAASGEFPQLAQEYAAASAGNTAA